MGEYYTVQSVVLHHHSAVDIGGWFSTNSISITMQKLIECSEVPSLLARHFCVWTGGTCRAKQEQGIVILVSRCVRACLLMYVVEHMCVCFLRIAFQDSPTEDIGLEASK